MPRKTYLPDDFVLRRFIDLWNDPATSRREMIRRMGWGQSTLYRWAQILKLPMRNPHVRAVRAQPITGQQAADMLALWRAGQGKRAISQAVGVSEHRVAVFIAAYQRNHMREAA